ncbi:penicillin-binding protein 1C [Cohaesibacter sp. ES.047]|uniref:penicillin-binding protein 1C n=1 Tax=Cohaesibacter sp. ES.047 TaxID=1798205 RepID=UPI000BB97004|nr:penicillin-binding protein 1C [Cohaesibacter sp. ES.047]SNY92671.1 penicillin-binding protein 1C [Cohaesibacter sp. ES.047]
MTKSLKTLLQTMPKPLFGMGAALGLLLFLMVGIAGGFWLFDRYNSPPLGILESLSEEVLDRDGNLLRAFTTDEDRWRLKADLDAVDPEFIDILLAYEDKRFFSHHGIDPLAVLRASWQLLSNREIISGASTISMQLARLIEPREKRTFTAKFWQMARAIQLEQRMSKREILSAYLTLAPYGGNLEGIRAASLAYFAKEPTDLSLEQAALLVALPQSPEARRPDLYPDRARRARDKVLERMAQSGTIAQSEVARASGHPLSAKRHDMPQLAAHTADRLRRQAPKDSVHQTTLNADLQQRMEAVVRDGADRLGTRLSAALVLADAKTGDILAEVGSPDYVSPARSGWIDMSRALRSPGSALKPFIYGLAFEEGLVRSQTIITDQPVNFSGYRPKNFDMDYQGDVSIHDALLLSLNVPAVALLDAVGPARLMERLRSGGVTTELPEGGDVGLAIGLGGLGITLKDLTQLYTTFANRGHSTILTDQPRSSAERQADASASPIPVLDPVASWHVSGILKDASPPRGAPNLPIAYKTGTSYGYRDAWSVGFDGRYVIGVWVGRADNSAVPGITGRTAAAPILFEAFSRSGLSLSPLPSKPYGAQEQTLAELPPTLRRFEISKSWLTNDSLPEPAPKIDYPPRGAQIEMTRTASGQVLPVLVKLQDGRPPFRWLVNGKVLQANGNRRKVAWQPSGAGLSTLTVIDSAGRADSVSIYLTLP